MANVARSTACKQWLGCTVFGLVLMVMSMVHGQQAMAQAQQVRFVTLNVNFNNTANQIRSDVRALRPESDIMMLQEAKWVTIDNFLGNLWTVIQVVDQGDAKRGSALAIRNSIMSEVLNSGVEFGVPHNGEQMLDRYIAWADVKLNNGLTIRVMSLHMPPPRYGYLQPWMADNLADFVADTPYPVVVGGDWNFNVNNDPHGIENMTGLESNGVGIDGFYYDTSVVDFLSKSKLTALNVNSDHDPVRIVTNVAPAENIIDNNSPGFSASSNWILGTSATDKYGANYRFRTTALVSDAATWSFSVPYAGDYEIYAWWSQGANRSITAPYILPDSTTVYKNQQTGGGSWQSLGTLSLSAGNHQVALSCWTSNGAVVIGDAIRIVPR